MTNEPRKATPAEEKLIAGMETRKKIEAAAKMLVDRRRDALTLLRDLISVGLYQPLELSDQSDNELQGLRMFDGKLDMFCPDCKKDSTWQVAPTEESNRLNHDQNITFALSKVAAGAHTAHLEAGWLGHFELRAACTRGDHPFRIYLHADKRSSWIEVQKIGQFPSARDIELGDVKEFDEGLTEKMRKEYVRAITCAGHGLSVAACVHYRRIFEDILYEAKDQHMAANTMPVWEEFDRAHVSEKLTMVRNHLPSFVVEHPSLYGLLSKGVHQLSEKECAEEMPTLRRAMEVIFRDRTTKAREVKQKAEAAKLVQQAVARHSKPA